MHYSRKDLLLNALDNVVKTMTNSYECVRPYPAQGLENPALSDNEKSIVAALMRVNHAGEICAQGLYSGQAFTAKLDQVRDSMKQASMEEIDHLKWCQTRLDEVDGVTSIFNPLWYIASFSLGAITGALGDTISLSFVAEVEKQVHDHLQKHIDQLPPDDVRSKAILTVMQADENNHREKALASGGNKLPQTVQTAMSAVSKIMTTISFKI